MRGVIRVVVDGVYGVLLHTECTNCDFDNDLLFTRKLGVFGSILSYAGPLWMVAS